MEPVPSVTGKTAGPRKSGEEISSPLRLVQHLEQISASISDVDLGVFAVLV
jgi:hypothetical protein